MKKTLTILISFLCLPFISSAQKELDFYYLAHDHYTRDLVKVLDDVRYTARYDSGTVTVFYLANGNTPRYFVVGPNDQESYDDFVEELNRQVFHSVYPEVDRAVISDILSQGKLIPYKGFDDYTHVTFNYFITKSFVQKGLPDSLVARLYWTMDLYNLPSKKLDINVFYNPVEKITEASLFSGKYGQIDIMLDSY